MLLTVIVGLVVKVINSTSIEQVNTEREYLLDKIKSDSLELISAEKRADSLGALADGKQKIVYKTIIKYEKLQDSVRLLDSVASFRYFNEWSSRPSITFAD